MGAVASGVRGPEESIQRQRKHIGLPDLRHNRPEEGAVMTQDEEGYRSEWEPYETYSADAGLWLSVRLKIDSIR